MRNKIIRFFPCLAVIVLLGILPAAVRAQITTPEGKAANELFQAKKWPEAAEAYAAIVKAAPQNGPAWFRLGTSLHSLKKYDLAAAAFEKAAAIMQFPGAMYNAAAAHARLGNTAKAWDWLKQAANAGFAQPDVLKADEDLAPMRSDARFAEIMKEVTNNVAPCTTVPEYRQFDFWVGDWEVQGPMGNPPASSKIESIIGTCVIFENYTNGPYAGKSFSYYDATINKWRQTWVDNAGGSSYFIGEFKDGVLRFEGESHARNAPASKIKMTFFFLGPDKVRQMGESLAADGKTWTVSYDLTYTRKK
ncbi:MAG: tetratricopeptide repeat protein [Pyrinomonadaceae bacterium]